MYVMNVTIWHLRSNYTDIDETIPYGQNVRTQAFLSAITNILQKLGHDVEIKTVRVAHPLRKMKTSKNKNFLIHFNRSTIIYRGFLKSLKIISDRLSLNYFKKILNALDSIIVFCKMEELKKELMDRKCVNILVFDDIGSCHLFKDISSLKEGGRNIIIYLSHDYYINATPRLTSNRIKNSEENIIKFSDLIVTSSLRDLELYRENYDVNHDNIVSFANVFPPINPPYSLLRLNKTLSIEKEKNTTIALSIGAKVSEKHVLTYLREVSEAISKLENLKILTIGDKLATNAKKFVWGDNEIESMPHISSRLEFLKQLSRAHIGVNYAYKPMGTNVKRFDFALAGLVIISRYPGSRGELLPYEYVYVDSVDLRIKLKKLIRHDLKKMGERNRIEALDLANESYENLSKKLELLMKSITM